MTREPRYAYEDPADLAWGAALLRKAIERKRAREAAEQRWAVIAHDGLGVTVERTGADPDALADEVASWAQQEEDKWPEMGLMYMLLEPGDVDYAREIVLEQDRAFERRQQ